MFKLTNKATFDKQITTNVLNDKGGYTKAQFTIQYHRLNQSQIDEMIAEITARPDSETQEQERKSDINYAKRLVSGFGKDLCDENGEPLEFTESNLDALLNEPGAASAIVKTFFDTIGGLRAKN